MPPNLDNYRVIDIRKDTIALSGEIGEEVYFDAINGILYLHKHNERIALVGIEVVDNGLCNETFTIEVTTDTVPIMGSRFRVAQLERTQRRARTHATLTGYYVNNGAGFIYSGDTPTYMDDDEITDSPELDDFLDSFKRS